MAEIRLFQRQQRLSNQEAPQNGTKPDRLITTDCPNCDYNEGKRNVICTKDLYGRGDKRKLRDSSNSAISCRIKDTPIQA